MTLSNAQPIQFWLNGQTVYNDQVIPQMQDAKFLQKFNSTDTVKVQLTDTVSNAYTLKIYDHDDALLTSVAFDVDLVNDVYVATCSFTFDSLAISNKVVYLVIVSTTFNVSASLTDPGETVSGNLEQNTIFSISGALTDPGETVSASIDFTPVANVTLAITLAEAVTGTPTWRAFWTDGVPNTTQDVIGTGTTGPDTKTLSTSNVSCLVTRPSGVPLAASLPLAGCVPVYIFKLPPLKIVPKASAWVFLIAVFFLIAMILFFKQFRKR